MQEAKGPSDGNEIPLVPSKWRIPASSGLRRPRLLAALETPWKHRLVLVAAPAGCGKTTLLTQFAGTANVPVAWYRAESPERNSGLMLRYLAASLKAALRELEGDLTSIEGIAAALHNCQREILLMLDDLQALEGSAAEQALGRLLRLLPENVAVIAASRSHPRFNLSRLLLDGAMTQIDAEALRFRAWEAERLYVDFYRDPLPPEDLARLNRKINGWAAGLHLFHLATQGQPSHVRRQKLTTLSGSLLLIREYLTDNVIQDLPAELRTFLIKTCVLERLTGPVCDRLRDSHGSSALLRELEKRRLLSGSEEEGYRCHDVLRSHLEALLVESCGEEQARAQYLKGATILEGEGRHAEALYPYLRAEKWAGIHRILAAEGPRLASTLDPWIDLIPPQMLEQNPWLMLVTARRHRRADRWQQAIDFYSKAEAQFESQTGRDIASSERKAVIMWLERPLDRLSGWDGLIRSATISGHPSTGAPESSRVRETVAVGVAALLRGDVNEAEEILRGPAHFANASEPLRVGARLAHAIANLLASQSPNPEELQSVLEDADDAGIPWLGWIGRAALALTDREDGEAAAKAAAAHFGDVNDPWGRSFSGLLMALGALQRGQEPRELMAAAEEFRSLGAFTLEAWCQCIRAAFLSRTHCNEAKDVSLQAESLARSACLTGPLSLAHEALAITDSRRAAQHRSLAREIRHRSGFTFPGLPQTAARDGNPNGAVVIRCFGEFHITIDGERLDLNTIKPRVRQLLRLLAIHAPSSVHCDVIGTALWPNAKSEVVRRNVQVAVSRIRKLLATASTRAIVVRKGESYGLSLPPESTIDVHEFERRISEGKRAWARKDLRSAASAFESALALHSADLLTEEGPAEWVVTERERFRTQAVEAAELLADAYLLAQNAGAAVQACEHGLRLDRYQDGLWRRLLKAHRRAGNQAAAAKARAMYQGVLAELGLTDQSASWATDRSA